MLFVGALAGVALFASTVLAAEKNPCSVDRVDTDGNRIAIWCSGDSNVYYIFKTGYNTCTGASVDTMKMWLSQAQSALLSGKPLQFFYNAPAGSCVDRTITSVGLKNS